MFVDMLLFCRDRCVLSGAHSEEKLCDVLKQQLPSARVSVQITNRGFHRELLTSVELSPGVPRGLGVLLLHRWPRGVYVDPFQLASLGEQRDWQIALDSAVDLEAAAHQAEGFITRVYPAVDGPTPRIKVTIPFHVRYHEPRHDGEAFTSVEIEPPQLLLRTARCLQLDGSQPHAAVDAACTHANASTCPWVRVPQQVILHSKLNPGSTSDQWSEAPSPSGFPWVMALWGRRSPLELFWSRRSAAFLCPHACGNIASFVYNLYKNRINQVQCR
ncbi:phosphatidylinositol-glycan biosynthesis class X protein isoform 2-T2 [Spinachia spinachia]